VAKIEELNQIFGNQSVQVSREPGWGPFLLIATAVSWKSNAEAVSGTNNMNLSGCLSS
jgi:hypothetical protein